MTTIEQRARTLADSLASTVTTIVMGDSFEMDMEAAERMVSDALKEVRNQALGEAEQAIRRAPSLDENGYITEKSAAITAIRVLIDTPASEVPADTELTEYVHGVVKEYGKYIDSEDGLSSLLYDVDLLPEQLLHVLQVNPNAATPNCGRMIAICELWKQKAPESDAPDPRDAIAYLRNWAMDLASSEDPDEQTDARKLISAANEIERLREVVTACGTQFRDYERQHLAKSPPDVTKAKTNADFAELCETARQTLDRDPAGDVDAKS